MPPKFSLQPVLDFRHQHVEALEIELASLLAAQQKGITFLERLFSYQTHQIDELHSQQEGDLNLITINHLRTNLKTVEARIRQQQVFLAELAQQVENKRIEVVGAKQDEETLNTLKNKEMERFHAEQVRQENRLQDDIYIAQAHRRAASH